MENVTDSACLLQTHAACEANLMEGAVSWIFRLVVPGPLTTSSAPATRVKGKVTVLK